MNNHRPLASLNDLCWQPRPELWELHNSHRRLSNSSICCGNLGRDPYKRIPSVSRCKWATWDGAIFATVQGADTGYGICSLRCC